MKTVIVNKKSELSAIAANYKFEQVYRTRLYCTCKGIPGINRRTGILIVEGNLVIAKLIKCKACAKEVGHE